MDNAHNNRGPVYVPACIVHCSRGAPPGVIKPVWLIRPRGKVFLYQQEVHSWCIRNLVTHRPRESAARGRPPSHWRRTQPGKPAFGPVLGEVHLVVNEKFNLLSSDFQVFINLFFYIQSSRVCVLKATT